MWPGNTADVTTLIPVIDRLRRRFAIARVCVVADRGMISAQTLAELEARRLLYILGVRERTDKLVSELVLDDPAPFVPLTLTKRGKEIDYEAKTVKLAGRRYIVCRNHQEAVKDAADRAAIVAALERQLVRGDKALVGNTGYRRYLKTIRDDHFAIDPDKVGPKLSPISTPSPRPRWSRTASASCSAPRLVPPRASPCAPPASRCAITARRRRCPARRLYRPC
jgi:hypothetical protein